MNNIINGQSASKPLSIYLYEEGSTTILSGSTDDNSLGKGEYIENIYIYGLIDPRNNEIRYIGKTNNLKKRYSFHINDKSKTHKTNWIKSLKKLNLLPELIILEKSNKDNWIELEKFYILKYKNLTNGTSGGDGFTNGISTKRKKIQVFNLKGNLLNVYDSIMETSKSLNIGTNHIISCAKGKIKTYKNYVFRYEKDNFDKFDIKNQKSKEIIQYDLNMNFINYYKSITEAAKELKTKEQSISRVLRGIRKKHKNYIFKYKDIV